MMTQRVPGLSSDMEILQPPADDRNACRLQERLTPAAFSHALVTRLGNLLSKSGAAGCDQHLNLTLQPKNRELDLATT
jgi:hypothetical protein